MVDYSPARQSRPRRSCLYLPGANARALEKARSVAADAVILDLEDAVAPEAKDVARHQVCAAVASRPFGRREVVVRINGLETPWGEADLKAAVAAGPDAILVPKVRGADDVVALDAALTDAGAPSDLALWAMIETPLAVLKLAEIAASSATTRLFALVMGTNDLAKDLQTRPLEQRRELLGALSQTVLAARAYGLPAIDGVFNAISDEAGFEAECIQGAALGFTGKTIIHPSQIALSNAAFSPSDKDIETARGIVAAFADPANIGKGVIKVDGQMVELLHLERAERLIAVHDAIQAHTEG